MSPSFSLSFQSIIEIQTKQASLNRIIQAAWAYLAVAKTISSQKHKPNNNKRKQINNN